MVSDTPFSKLAWFVQNFSNRLLQKAAHFLPSHPCEIFHKLTY
jgi:hypothetical protein